MLKTAVCYGMRQCAVALDGHYYDVSGSTRTGPAAGVPGQATSEQSMAVSEHSMLAGDVTRHVAAQ